MKDIIVDKTGWKKCKFGDVAIQTKGIVDIDNTDLTRYIAGEHMNSEDIHLRKWGNVGDGYLGPAFIRRFNKGDILYGSRRTYLKKVAIADFDGITANTTFVIKAKEELIEPILLVHLMLSDSFTEYSVKNSRGSVNPYINWKDIADYEFLLPPKAEQKRLTELLWAADEMIEKEKKVVCKVKDKINLTLSNVLGACQNGCYSSKKHEFIKIAKVLLNNKFNVGKLDTKDYQECGLYPIIDQSKNEVAAYSNNKEYLYNGILPVLIFGDHTTIVKYVDFPFILGADGTKILLVNEDIVLANYLYYAIQNLNIVPQGYRRHYSILKDLEIPLLSIERQKELISQLNKMESLIKQQKQVLYMSRLLKKELINKIF